MRLSRLLCVCVFGMQLFSVSATAADVQPASQEKSALTQDALDRSRSASSANTPSTALGNKQAAPTAKASTTQVQGQPQIRLCNNPKDITGIWRLARVFETPEGERSADLKAFPHQFLWINKNSSFSQLKSKKPPRGKKNVRNRINKQGADTAEQYVFDAKKGVIFIYKKQQFVRSYHCGVVNTPASIYKKGDMVLTPTKNNKTKKFELYRRMKR